MEQHGKYRHELKYSITPAEYMALRGRLGVVMQPDPHTGPDGHYTIRSIYFDNFRDKALREKIDGVQVREKFRIRYYNDDLSYMTLEKKIKHNDLCMKVDAPITEEECRMILSGPDERMMEHKSQLVRELYCKMRYQQLKPRVLVSYTREPYVYKPGNVRITFDSDIRTTLFRRDFLEKDVRDIDACDVPGQMILEVKFDNCLPGIIACLIQTGTMRQQAFSKYGACRRFG